MACQSILRGGIFLAALLILSACSVISDSTPPPETIPISPLTFPATSTVPTAVPGALPTPTHPIFIGPLSVKILEPGDNQVVEASPVQLRGQAEPGTVVTIDDEVILVDQSGVFEASLALVPGDNLIEITASDAENAQGFAYLNVVYEPQP